MTVVDAAELSARLDQCSLAIARSLATKQSGEGRFMIHDSYGRAFSALLWSRYGSQFADPISKAIGSIIDEQSRPLPANYHYEFIRYALLRLFIARPDLGKIQDVLPRELYRGTRVANWTLLRAFCRFHSERRIQRATAAIEVAMVRYWFSHKSGLIEDQKGAYTMQYHAFCTALLGELLAGPMKGSSSIETWFRASVDAFSELVLPGGQCNYIGRGSLQIFGYAAAVLALAHAYRTFGQSRYRANAAQILAFIEAHEARDGSLPLVLRDSPEGRPEAFDLKDPDFAGWWSYNNYYDYLAFTGVMLRLAAEILELCKAGDAEAPARPMQSRRLGTSIAKVERRGYTAVFTLPNRKLWAASVPVPYLAIAGNYPLPCYGGEQQLESIYSERGVPLPIILLQGERNIVFSRVRYRWVDPSSFGTETGGFRHARQFAFDAQEIIIRDDVAWSSGQQIRSVRMLRILIPSDKVLARLSDTVVLREMTLKFSGPVREEDERHYSANGALACFYTTPDISGKKTSISAYVVMRIHTGEHESEKPRGSGYA